MSGRDRVRQPAQNLSQRGLVMVSPTTRAPATRQFSGVNWAYLAGAYEQYLANPSSVPEDIRQYFDVYGFPAAEVANPEAVPTFPATPRHRDAEPYIRHVLAAKELARNIRQYGHLAAKVVPTDATTRDIPELSLATYGLTEDVLQQIPARLIWPNAPADAHTALDVISRLKQTYCSAFACDFAHVYDLQERAWLDEMVESGGLARPLSADEQKALLKRLVEVEGFERFLHRTYAGQKRFSIEGLDTLVPMLDALVHFAVAGGAKDILIGMAHRGRLNVLAHVLGKPYEAILAEFQSAPNKELVPSEGSEGINRGWTGDVKYHLGYYRTVNDEGPVQARIRLANNPSHLEFVNPVVLGYTRAAQEDRSKPGAPKRDPAAAMGVLIHGDAAFPGEGVVAETFNFSRIPGYTTNGTVHIIANNRLGFTAEEEEARSTRYASDLAKGFGVPVVHVSADDPEACLAAVRLAYMYRTKFGKDFLIDLVGYRRWGHNEMDDPVVTQPQLYQKIQQHPTVKTIYAKALLAREIVSEADVRQMEAEVLERLRQAHQNVRVDTGVDARQFAAPTQTARPISLSVLESLNETLQSVPPNFTVYPKLAKVLERRRDALREGGPIDWAHAEALAFATILAEGTPIRITGQDTERGTFAHRHAVLHDPNTGAEHIPLQSLPQARASFAIHNSPLTETAVLGFEYGYNVQAEDTLVLWEAQFGDFANVAQVIIDQFIVSGQAKWGQSSGLVMLLPHGYEGQGPEHSSARPERYLQLAANNNIVIANVTTAAQYFHLLRRQAARLGPAARPLILMTPKSLLRHPKAASAVKDLVHGTFQPVLSIFGQDSPESVRRLVLSSGKVGVDLVTAMEERPANSYEWLAHARIEELYPFPTEPVQSLFAQYPNLEEIVWLQEEPENMGAWRHVQPYLQRLLPANVALRYVGRPESASPAEGHAPDHNREQSRILEEALSPTTR